MSDTDEKKRGGRERLVSIAAFAVLTFAAWQFSLLPIGVKNLAVPYSGGAEKSAFYETDSASPLFSEAEKAELSSEITQAAEKLQMNIAVVAGRTPLEDAAIEDFAHATFDKLYGEYTDGVLFYMDLSGKVPAYDYVSTSGKAMPLYKDNMSYILDDVYEYLPSSSEVQRNGFEPYIESFKDGVRQFLRSLEHYDAIADKESSRIFTSVNSSKKFYYSRGTFYVTEAMPPLHRFYLLMAGIILGFIASGIKTHSVHSSFTIVPAVSSKEYISENDVNINAVDKFLKTETSKTYNPPVSSSGSGGRTGGGGGSHYSGGAHGGGGHHR